MRFYVLSDPSGKYPVGSQIEDAEARVASTLGVAMIPIDKDIYQVRSAVGGFFRADYGSGIQMPVFAGPFSHLTLALSPVSSQIHWRACFVLEDSRDPYGSVRLTSDSSQYGQVMGINSDPIDLAPYKGRSEPFVVGGLSVVPSPPAGFVGFALWGLGNARLLWAAVSQTVTRAGDYVINPNDAPQPNQWNSERTIPQPKIPPVR